MICSNCQIKACKSCLKGDCCVLLKECPECKIEFCKDHYRKCFGCQKENCTKCMVKGRIENRGKISEVELCKICHSTFKCSINECQNHILNSEITRNCQNCKKIVCNQHLKKCEGCQNEFCINDIKNTVNSKLFCDPCFLSKEHIEFKISKLEKCLNHEDNRTMKITGEFEGIPLIKVKENFHQLSNKQYESRNY